MNTVLRIGALLLFALAVFGSAWYIAFRLRTTFGLQQRRLLLALVMAPLVGWLTLMVPATKSAAVLAGLSYVLGGYLFAGYVFLTAAFVLLHVIERAWPLPKARASAAALLLVGLDYMNADEDGSTCIRPTTRARSSPCWRRSI